MALSSWPRAYFDLPRGGATNAARNVAASIADALQAEYPGVESRRLWPAPVWVIIAGPKAERMVVLIRVYKAKGIKLNLAPLDGWSPFELLTGNERPITNGLRSLCMRVHPMLADVKDGCGLRWYLKGAMESVASPAELPW